MEATDRNSRDFSKIGAKSPARVVSAPNGNLQPNADPDAPGRNGFGKTQPAVISGIHPGNTNGEYI
jgi:hypothetical protein